MYDFAIKRGGLSFNRIIYQQTAAMKNGFFSLPITQRLRVEYKVRKYEGGKEVEKKYLRRFNEAFPIVPYKR